MDVCLGLWAVDATVNVMIIVQEKLDCYGEYRDRTAKLTGSSQQAVETVQSQLAACCAESLPALTNVDTSVLTCFREGVHDVETVVAWKHWSVKSEASASS